MKCSEIFNYLILKLIQKIKCYRTFDEVLKYDEIGNFLDSYQIMRNLCHINDNSYVVFLFPKENRNIHLQTQSAQTKILTNKGRDKFRILHLESATDEILRQVRSAKLQEHYKEFQIKYLNYAT